MTTTWMPEPTSHALPSLSHTWEIWSWMGRLIGITNDPIYAEQMGQGGFIVKEIAP